MRAAFQKMREAKSTVRKLADGVCDLDHISGEKDAKYEYIRPLMLRNIT
jgi:hypothetical protein